MICACVCVHVHVYVHVLQWIQKIKCITARGAHLSQKLLPSGFDLRSGHGSLALGTLLEGTSFMFQRWSLQKRRRASIIKLKRCCAKSCKSCIVCPWLCNPKLFHYMSQSPGVACMVPENWMVLLERERESHSISATRSEIYLMNLPISHFVAWIPINETNFSEK